MTATIILRDNPTSGSVPIPSAIHQAELVLNTADGRLFTKNASGQIILLNARPTVNGVDYQNISNIPIGLVSSSAQASTWTVATASLANAIDYANIFSVPPLVSSSTQISYTGLLNIPSGIVSSSTQASTWTVATASLANAIVYDNITGVPIGLVSSSTQIDYTSIQNKPTTIATASYVAFANIVNVPTLVSSSTQIDYTGLLNVPVGIVSSSAQISYPNVSNIPSGIISSSTQASTWTVATASLANAIEYVNIVNVPTLVSSSAQIDYTSIQNKPTTIATASYVNYVNIVNVPTLVSSSAQIDYIGLLNVPVGIVSSSTQASTWTVATASLANAIEFVNIRGMPSLVSASTQIDYTSLQNKPTTIATASYVDFPNVANVPSLVSSSTQISYIGITNVPTGVVSSSLQLTSASLSANAINDPLIKNYAEVVAYPTITANAVTVDLTTANVFDILVNANITTLTISNPPSSSLGSSFSIIARYNGSFSITWPTEVKWPGGSAPTISTTSGSTDIFSFVTNNAGGKYYGIFVGKGF